MLPLAESTNKRRPTSNHPRKSPPTCTVSLEAAHAHAQSPFPQLLKQAEDGDAPPSRARVSTQVRPPKSPPRLAALIERSISHRLVARPSHHAPDALETQDALLAARLRSSLARRRRHSSSSPPRAPWIISSGAPSVGVSLLFCGNTDTPAVSRASLPPPPRSTSSSPPREPTGSAPRPLGMSALVATLLLRRHDARPSVHAPTPRPLPYSQDWRSRRPRMSSPLAREDS